MAVQRARASSNFGAYIARERQVLSGYSADAWSMTALKPGSIVYGGVPGQTAFYTDFAAVRASALNSERLFKSLQVQPNPLYGYRPGIMAYRVTMELRVPAGYTLNNARFGVGGARQFFILNYGEALTPIRQFPLIK